MGEYEYKIVLLGNPSVGKTSLILRFVEDKFTETQPTLGVGFHIKTIQMEYQGKSHEAALSIWDIAGQTVFEDAPALKQTYCKDANTVILVYDLSSKQSFEDLNPWLKMIEDYVPTYSVMCLVGNKNDLKDQRAVTLEQGQEKAKAIKADIFFETSAKTGMYVEEMFKELAFNLVQASIEKFEI